MGTIIEIKQALNDFIRDAVIQVAVTANTELIKTPPIGTPVDTGWARSNWVANIGSPKEQLVGSPESISSGEQQVGIAKILTYKKSQGSIFITNNVPYINRLNRGHSKQTPKNFVQRAIKVAVKKVTGR